MELSFLMSSSDGKSRNSQASVVNSALQTSEELVVKKVKKGENTFLST